MIRRLVELRRLQSQATLPAEALGELQWERLQRLLHHAYEEVPFYRRKFDSAGIRPSDIRGLDDLALLPLTLRAELQDARPEDRIARACHIDELVQSSTSGSTGHPVTVYNTANEFTSRMAVQMRALLMAGFRPRDRLAQIGMSRGQHRAGLHERLGFFRANKISPAESLDEQYRQIRNFDPTILWAYPNTLQALREHIGRPMGEWLNVRAVITSAEVLREELRRVIDDELGVERFNFYGTIEFGRIAQECPAHEGLHINTDRFIVECLRDGRPAEPGESGSVVVTALNALASPLIRYELGDYVALLDHTCSCGCAFPLMGHPQGRLHEMVVLPSGKKISPMLFTYGMAVSNVGSQYRIIQHRRDLVELLFINDKEEEAVVAARIRKVINEKLDEPMELVIRRVDEIPNEGVKARAFISKLND